MSPALLDTHALVWLVAHPDRLGRQALKLAKAAQEQGCLYVSAISFWEIAILAEAGVLRLKSKPEKWRAEALGLGLMEIELSGSIAIRATELMDFHQDPADRFIAATAAELGATLVTADAVLLEWRSKVKRQDARR